MPRTKVIDRSPVEILLDDGRAHVRAARYRRSVSQPLSDRAHDVCDRLLRLGVALADAVLGERDCGRQRAAPGAKILRGELVAHVLTDVVVEHGTRERAGLTVVAVPK